MKITIDRLEGNFAMVELPDGTTVNAPGELFPGGVEGDIFEIEKRIAETVSRKKEMEDRFQRLIKK